MGIDVQEQLPVSAPEQAGTQGRAPGTRVSCRGCRRSLAVLTCSVVPGADLSGKTECAIEQ